MLFLTQETKINRLLRRKFATGWQVVPAIKKKAGLASGLDGDEVIYAFTKALRRATRPTWGRCPSRAASKTSMPTLNGQRNFRLHCFRRISSEKGSKLFSKSTSAIARSLSPTPKNNVATLYYLPFSYKLKFVNDRKNFHRTRVNYPRQRCLSVWRQRITQGRGLAGAGYQNPYIFRGENCFIT